MGKIKYLTDVDVNKSVPEMTTVMRELSLQQSRSISKKVIEYSSLIRAMQRTCEHPEGFAIAGKSGRRVIGECPYCHKEKLY